MAKVLLMVERDGRWVCASRNAANRPMWWVRAMAKDGATKLRWKLVEAESADAARKVIAGRVQCTNCFGWFDRGAYTPNHICYAANPKKCEEPDPMGRILASGGKGA